MVEHISSHRLIGANVGNYRLEQLLEQHKWGPVYLARNKAGNNYMLRFLGMPALDGMVGPASLPAVSPDARIVFLGRFQQEANQVATLQHPNILPLLDYGNYQGVPYLVYPHLPLPSLRALLTQNAPTDLVSIGRFLDQIAFAMEYAHERAVLHRNLSTRCIYVKQDRQLVVAEFGLLRVVELSKQDLTAEDDGPQRQSYDGSNESGAPEQWLGKPIDACADIYAMGTVLYRLLTGHAPFSGKTREEVARQHLYARIPPISTWRQGLPNDLDHIIMKAMAKEPLQRYRQPGALAQAYRQIVAPDQQSSSRSLFPASAPRPVAGEQWQPAKEKPQLSRRRVLALTGLSGGVVAAAALAFGLHFLQGGKAANTSTAMSTPSKPAQTPGPTPRSVPAHTGTVLARVTDLPENSAKTFPIANHQNPGVLIHLADGRFVAFDSTCTHVGCQVSYNQQDNLLECPCHGAVFDPAKSAAVVQGPAQTPLAAIKITVNPDGTITTG